MTELSNEVSLDLWIEGGWGTEGAVWSKALKLDLARLHYDQYYADLVHQYIQRALEFMAEGVEEIGVICPPEPGYR